jgi:hypothetical protein
MTIPWQKYVCRASLCHRWRDKTRRWNYGMTTKWRRSILKKFALIQQDSGINLDDREVVDYDMKPILFYWWKATTVHSPWHKYIDFSLSWLFHGRVSKNWTYWRLGKAVQVPPLLQEQNGQYHFCILGANLMSEHSRIRGQTALDSVPEAFKTEEAGYIILRRWLQIAQRTNRAILSSNDKNLQNWAIVYGIKA